MNQQLYANLAKSVAHFFRNADFEVCLQPERIKSG